MKFLTIAATLSLLLTGAANAGTLNCVGDRIAYSYDGTDGGAPRDPLVSLVVYGQVLIRSGMGENEPVSEARFELAGPRTVIKKRRTSLYTTTYFEQEARVSSQDSLFYLGQVLCKEVSYIGPPRP